MKVKLRFYLLFIYVFISQLVFSQNLVPNGDFENYSALPDTLSQFSLCNGWSNANGFATPDYLHILGSGSVQLPNSIFGTVSPYSGAAIMGFYTYVGSILPNYREYISTQLSSPMIIGNTYTVSFWLTNGSANHLVGNSSNHLGLKFSSSPLTQPGYDAIGGTPQLEIPNQVWATTWQQFSFTFTADSSYQFITIGNFYDDASTSASICVTTNFNAAYYFIDKVEIIPQDLNIISDNSFCLGDSALFTSSHLNPVDSVLWNFDDPLSGSANTSTNSSPMHIFTNPGTYNVRLIGYFGNNADTVVKPIAILNALPMIDLGNDTTFCQGGTLTLNASIPNTTYLWNNGSTNSILNVSQPGNYWVAVTNGCGTSFDTIQVSEALPLTLFLGNDTTLCQGETLTLDATVPNTTYLWNNGSTNPIFNVSQPGNYWVAVINTCGASSYDEINVSYTSTPILFLGNDTTLCQGETLTLDTSVPSTSYLWNTGSTSPILIPSQSGNYWLVATNACGTYSDTIHVDYILLPTSFLGNDTVLCQGDTLMLDATLPNTTYLWNNGSTDSILNVSQPGSYWVNITNSCGVSSDIIEVNYTSPPPNAFFGNDTTLCQGETLLLMGSITFTTCLWNNGSTIPYFIVSQPGNYWVQLTNVCGTSSDTIQVSYVLPSTIFLGNDTTLCQGETLTLDASVPNTTCVWNNGSTNPIFNVSQPGNYWVMVTNDYCSSSDSLTVNFSQLPKVNLGNDKILCLGDKLTLDATVSNANYVWQNGSTDPTLEVTQQGIYWVEVTVNNCSAADTITIDIKDCSIALELPNVITANGDGVNGLFVPIVSKGIASMKTTIYNRWGNPVFETTKLSIDWDGQDCSDGTYFWIINYTDENGKENRLDGFVTLIK